MNIYIFVDMEGISGISGSEFVSPDGAKYQEGRRYYTEDVNVCADACYEAGAKQVIARDGHGGGNHLLWDKIDSRVEVVQGQTPHVRMSGVDECDALILLGYHAMAGTPEALLEHTYSSKSIQNVWLNGKKVGEIGIDAGVASDYAIPTILVSGDDKACREAEDWIPGVVTCQVKKGISCQGARLLSPDTAHALIRSKVREALDAMDKIKPMEVKRPVTLRKQVVERFRIPRERENLNVIDGHTFEVTADTVEKALFETL